MQPDEYRYERGLAKMREMFGPGIDSALTSLAATSPDLMRCLVEFPFGDIYTRSQQEKRIPATLDGRLPAHYTMGTSNDCKSALRSL